jgi:hypothetical protein
MMRIHSGKDERRFRSGRTPTRIADAVKGKGAGSDVTIWFAVKPAEFALVLEDPQNYRYDSGANTFEFCFVDGDLRIISGKTEGGHNVYGVEERIRKALE